MKLIFRIRNNPLLTSVNRDSIFWSGDFALQARWDFPIINLDERSMQKHVNWSWWKFEVYTFDTTDTDHVVLYTSQCRTVSSVVTGRSFSLSWCEKSEVDGIWKYFIPAFYCWHLTINYKTIITRSAQTQICQALFLFSTQKTLKFFMTVERERHIVAEKLNNKKPLMIVMIPDINIPNGNIFKCISFIWYSL